MPASSALADSSCSALHVPGKSGSSRMTPTTPCTTPSGTGAPPTRRLPAASSASLESKRNSADQSPSSATRSALVVKLRRDSSGWPTRSMRAASASSVAPSLNVGKLHASERLVGGMHDERPERAHHIHESWRQRLQGRGDVFAHALDAQNATD